VVSFTPRPLYRQGKISWYPLDGRLGGPQRRSGHGVEEKNSMYMSFCDLSTFLAVFPSVAYTVWVAKCSLPSVQTDFASVYAVSTMSLVMSTKRFDVIGSVF